jgi:hypothetical protein
VKEKSATAYAQIDSNIGNIETLLKATSPDKAKLLTDLKGIAKGLTDSVAKL